MIRRRKKRMLTKNKTRYILAGLIGVLFTMSVGFSLLSQRLAVNGVADISTVFDIQITGITESSMSNAETVEKSANKTTGTIKVNLNEENATAIYNVTVKNNGNVDAIITNILGIDEANKLEPIDIVVSTNNLEQYTTLLQGKTITFQIVVKWDTSIATSSSAVSKTIEFKVECQQKTSANTPTLVEKSIAVSCSGKTYNMSWSACMASGIQSPGGSDPIYVNGNFEVGKKYRFEMVLSSGLEFYTGMSGPLYGTTTKTEYAGSWSEKNKTYSFTFSPQTSETQIMVGSGGTYMMKVGDTTDLQSIRIYVYEVSYKVG